MPRKEKKEKNNIPFPTGSSYLEEMEQGDASAKQSSLEKIEYKKIVIQQEREDRENQYEKKLNLPRLVLSFVLHALVIAYAMHLLLHPYIPAIMDVLPSNWISNWKYESKDMQDFLVSILPAIGILAIILVTRPASFIRTILERSSDSSGSGG